MKTELGRTSVAEGAAERPRAATGVEILPAASGDDSYGLSVCFSEMASGGSSHNRPTSAEDHEEALLLGCPPIGRSDREWRAVRESSSGEKEGPYILGLKTPRLYGPPGKACFFSIGRVSVVADFL